MLAQKESLPGRAGASTTAVSLGSPPWRGQSGTQSSAATRHLLVLASHRIDNPVVDNLRRANWSLHFAENPAEASALVARYDILVGLNVASSDDTKKHSEEMREVLSRFRQIRWVGAFPRERIEEESVIGLVTEYLYDFLSLPLDPARLDVILGHAYGMAAIANRYIQNQNREHVSRFGMVGASPSMRDLFHDIERAGRCDLPVVIVGETGTGKETTARAIHASSIRGDGRFVTLRCAAIPAPRIQDELDAFATPIPRGVADDRTGQREGDHGGTLFLDEVSDLPREAQMVLLRFIEDQGIFRPNTTRPNRRNVRLICATNGNLEKLARNDQFHMDLYYHLRALTIEVPSLRGRQSDVRILAQHFLDEFRRHDNSLATGFSQDALTAIEQYVWPGNALELRNRIHQAALCCRAAFITPGDLRLAHDGDEGPTLTLQEAREAAEKQTIWLALRRNRQNLSHAAKELRVSRMTLYRLLSRHGMDRCG